MDDLIIEGLTVRQHEIANRLWQMETEEEIDHYINSLPRRARVDAITVKEMMIAACIDQAIRQDPDLHVAADVLRRYMRDPDC